MTTDTLPSVYLAATSPLVPPPLLPVATGARAPSAFPDLLAFVETIHAVGIR
jgi:hypothetical protein